MARRRVRVTEALFEQVDRQLRAERGPAGEPSSQDFVLYELPEVVEQFATGWDDLPPFDAALDGGRLLMKAGIVVRTFAVFGVLLTDGSIDLIAVTIDSERPEY